MGKDVSVVESSSKDELPDMETNLTGQDEEDSDSSNIDLEDLINHEVWDGAIVSDIDEDFSENSAPPSVEVNPASSSRSFNSAFVYAV